MRKEEQEMEATAAVPVRLDPAVPGRLEERVTDGDLLLRIADGDTRAFETLYRRFARPVLGLALRLLRDRGRAEEAVQETFADPPETASADAGPADRAESAYVAWRVHRAVVDLPPNEREVLELAYWGNLSQSEIAHFLGIPLGTVKTRTRTGLARLADLLEGELR